MVKRTCGSCIYFIRVGSLRVGDCFAPLPEYLLECDDDLPSSMVTEDSELATGCGMYSALKEVENDNS